MLFCKANIITTKKDIKTYQTTTSIYPNFPDVDAITKAAYVKTNPTAKCVSPTRRACTIERATGLSFYFTKFASGVRSCAHTSVSISSCQYPRHEIRNMNPVA